MKNKLVVEIQKEEKQTLESLEKFPNEFNPQIDISYKAKQMIRILYKSYENCKQELKGIFTLNEAWFLINGLNGAMYIEKYGDKDHLIAIIEDSSYYEYMDQQWDVSRTDFVAKISNLTEFQCLTVMFMAYEFWNDSETRAGNAVDEFVKQIFMVEDQK